MLINSNEDSNEEVEIFDTNFNKQYSNTMMKEFDDQMKVSDAGSYSLIDGNWNGMIQIMKTARSPLKAFISLNACKKKNNDSTPFFNENNTCLLQTNSENGNFDPNAFTQIVQHILSMQPGSYYNVILPDTHEVDFVFFKNDNGSVSMVIIDSNGMCVDAALANVFITSIRQCVWSNWNPLITQELVIGTNGIGSGSGYCGAFAQNMLYTLEKNNSKLLKELISFAKQCNPLTNSYYTEKKNRH